MSDLAARYGTRRPLRRPLTVGLVALVAAVALGWLVWAMLLQSSPEVRSQLQTFHVRGEHRVDARFTVVRRDRDVAASCLLRAYAVDHTTVGEAHIPVGTAEAAATTLVRSVRTERRASSVELVGCTAPGQPRPR